MTILFDLVAKDAARTRDQLRSDAVWTLRAAAASRGEVNRQQEPIELSHSLRADLPQPIADEHADTLDIVHG